jgi:hypothetical protein
MASIRVIQAEIVRIRTECNYKVAALEAEIDAIRAKRGTKLKAKGEGHVYFEQGRSREPSLGPGYY